VFSSRGSLYTHTRTHYNLRPYGCTLCHRNFLSKPNLKAGLRIRIDLIRIRDPAFFIIADPVPFDDQKLKKN
jgi:hypothetical protein